MAFGLKYSLSLVTFLLLAGCAAPSSVEDPADKSHPSSASEVAPAEPSARGVEDPSSGTTGPHQEVIDLTSTDSFEGEGVYYYLLGQIMLRDHRWQEAEAAFEKVSAADPDATESTLMVASLATQRGDLAKAESFSSQVLARDPANQRARLLLAGIFMATKEFSKAAEHYESLIKLDGDNDQARLLLAQIYGYLHRADSAKGILQPLFRHDDLAWKAHLALGRAYVNQKTPEKAIGPFREAVRLTSYRLEPVLALGSLLQEMGREKEAETVYRHHLTRHPDNQVIHNRLGRLFLDQNNRDAALAEFRAITKQSPDSVQARLTTALILMSQDKTQDALKELRLAEAVQPDNAGVRYYLGQALESLDQDEEALLQYDKIPKGETFYIESQLRMGFLEAKAKKNPEAIQRMRNLLELGEKKAEIYLGLSILLLQEKDYTGVLEACNKGLELDAGQSRLTFNRAMALDKLGRWSEAEQDLQTYLEKHPDDAHALNYLGYTWADRNENLQKAHELLKKASQLSPGDGFITDSLGWVLFRLNRLEESLSVMREAVRMEPDDAAILEHLGDVYQAMGNVHEAVSTWRRALQLDATNKGLEEKIRRHDPRK